jgi:hypothetical protein
MSVQWSPPSRFETKLIVHRPLSYMCPFYHAYHKLTDLTAPIIIAYELQEDKGHYLSVFSISLLIFFLFIHEDT